MTTRFRLTAVLTVCVLGLPAPAAAQWPDDLVGVEVGTVEGAATVLLRSPGTLELAEKLVALDNRDARVHVGLLDIHDRCPDGPGWCQVAAYDQDPLFPTGLNFSRVAQSHYPAGTYLLVVVSDLPVGVTFNGRSLGAPLQIEAPEHFADSWTDVDLDCTVDECAVEVRRERRTTLDADAYVVVTGLSVAYSHFVNGWPLLPTYADIRVCRQADPGPRDILAGTCGRGPVAVVNSAPNPLATSMARWTASHRPMPAGPVAVGVVGRAQGTELGRSFVQGVTATVPLPPPD